MLSLRIVVRESHKSYPPFVSHIPYPRISQSMKDTIPTPLPPSHPLSQPTYVQLPPSLQSTTPPFPSSPSATPPTKSRPPPSSTPQPPPLFSPTPSAKPPPA
ncbi:hypothetical protein ACMFMG_008972 [Clarireedia jacksonii]